MKRKADIINAKDFLIQFFKDKQQISSILAYGSLSQNIIDEKSDLDLLIICRQKTPSIKIRKKWMSEINPDWIFSNQAELIPLFARTDRGQVQGVPVEITYIKSQWVESVLKELLAGNISCKLTSQVEGVGQLIHYSKVLLDKDDFIKLWKSRLSKYPEKLRANILINRIRLLKCIKEEVENESDRELGTALFIERVNDAIYVMREILMAINKVYNPHARKYVEQTIMKNLHILPRDYHMRHNYIITGPFDKTGVKERSKPLAELLGDIYNIAKKYINVD